MKKKFSSALVVLLIFLFAAVFAFCGFAVDGEIVDSKSAADTEVIVPSEEETTAPDNKDDETTGETPEYCPENEHKFIIQAGKKATLEEDGYERVVCELCGKIKSETINYRITDIVLSVDGETLKNNEFTYDGYGHYVSVQLLDAGGNVHTKNYFLQIDGKQNAKEIGTYSLLISYQDYRYDVTAEVSYSVVPPMVPQPAFVSAESTKSGVKLDWDKVKGVKGYEVFRKLSDATEWEKLATLTETEYTDKSAVYNKEYVYMVKAYKVVYYTEFYSAGEEKTVKAKYVITPDAPTLEVANYGVRVSWNPVAGATKYYIYRSVKKSGGYSKIGETKASKTKFGDKNATLGKTYYYKVKAYTGDKAGTASAYTSIKATLIAPTIKKNITANAKTFTFSWKKVAGADGYFIYKLDGKNYVKVGEVKGNSTNKYTYKSTKLVRLVVTTYFKNSKGTKIESPYSNTIFANAVTKPAIEFEVSGNEKVIYINSACNTSHYEIYYKVGKSGEWKLLEKRDTGGKVDGGYLISAGHKVKLNKNYYYRVRGVEIKADNVIYGEYSDVKQLTLGYISGVSVTLPNKNYESGASFPVTIKNGTKKALKVLSHGEIKNTDLASSGGIFIWSHSGNISAGKTEKITFSVSQASSPVFDTKMPAYKKTSKIILYFTYDGINYASVYNVKTGKVFK